MENQSLLFIDFEFSMAENKEKPVGFFPEIIEVGAVVVENGKIIETFSSYVKPVYFPNLTDRCKAFLGITQENINEGMEFSHFILKLKDIYGENFRKVIAWGNADEKVLKSNCLQHKISYPFKSSIVDLSMDYKQFFGDQNQTGLHKAVESYGKKGIGSHHRALDDALTTFEIYKLVERDKGYMNKQKMPTIGERIDWEKLREMTM